MGDRALWFIVGAILTLLLLVVFGLPKAHAETFRGEPSAWTYNVTTQNTLYLLPPAQARHDITRAARHSDLVLLQEMHDRRARRYAPAGFGTWQGAWGETALMWRLADMTFVRAHETIRGRAMVARFTLASGGCLRVLNVHMLAHVEREGHLASDARGRLYAHDMRAVARIAQRFPRCPMLLGGDWNMGYAADQRTRDPRAPYANLAAAGYLAQWGALPGDRPTFGPRMIDTFWWRGAQIEGLWQRVAGGTYSDHQRVRLGFTVLPPILATCGHQG